MSEDKSRFDEICEALSEGDFLSKRFKNKITTLALKLSEESFDRGRLFEQTLARHGIKKEI